MQPGKGLMTLNILHKAMLLMQFLFAAVVFYMVYKELQTPSMKEQERIFQVVAIVLSAAGFFAGMALFKKKLQEIRSMPGSAKDKFAAYRGACIIQWALLEGPCIFCIVAFFLTGNYAFMALAGVLILLFAMLSPTKDKVSLHLGLSGQELEDL